MIGSTTSRVVSALWYVLSDMVGNTTVHQLPEMEAGVVSPPTAPKKSECERSTQEVVGTRVIPSYVRTNVTHYATEAVCPESIPRTTCESEEIPRRGRLPPRDSRASPPLCLTHHHVSLSTFRSRH